MNNTTSTINGNFSTNGGDDSQPPSDVELAALDKDEGYIHTYNTLGYINITISVLGIIGNIVTAIVLKRHGLHRTSNILLFSLAMADAVFLFGEVSTTGRVYMVGDYVGWPGPYSTALFMFIIWVCHSMSYLIGNFLTMTIPALITTERLIATLLPFRFTTIVTPARTWASVGVLLIMSLFFSILNQVTQATFYYGFEPTANRTIGVKNIATFPQIVTDIRFYTNTAFSFIKGILPLCYVTLGCIIIGIKVRLAARRRQELTSKAADASKERHTTIMLVAVCMVYVITSGFHGILRYFPYTYVETNLKYFTAFECTFLTINSSVNFIIYVVFNKTLREMYKSVLLCRKDRPKQ